MYFKKSHAKTEKHVHVINELQLTNTISRFSNKFSENIMNANFHSIAVLQ